MTPSDQPQDHPLITNTILLLTLQCGHTKTIRHARTRPLRRPPSQATNQRLIAKYLHTNTLCRPCGGPTTIEQATILAHHCNPEQLPQPDEPGTPTQIQILVHYRTKKQGDSVSHVGVVLTSDNQRCIIKEANCKKDLDQLLAAALLKELAHSPMKLPSPPMNWTAPLFMDMPPHLASRIANTPYHETVPIPDTQP